MKVYREDIKKSISDLKDLENEVNHSFNRVNNELKKEN